MAKTVGPSGSISVELVLRGPTDLAAEVKVADIELPFRAHVTPDSDGRRLILDVDVSVDAVTDALLDILPPAPDAPDVESRPDIGRLLLGLFERRAEAYVRENVDLPLERASATLAAESHGWAALAIAVAIAGPDQLFRGAYVDDRYQRHIEAAGRVLDLITGAESHSERPAGDRTERDDRSR